MRWILTNIRSITLAFILAVVVWISAVTGSDPDVEKIFPTPISIEIIGQDPSLVPVGNIANSVNLTLKAPQSVLDGLVSNPELIRVFADLSGLDAGTHQVPLQVQINARPVKVVEVDPLFLDLSLEPLVSRTIKVELSVNGEPAVGYQLGRPVLEPSEVVVSGPQSLVDQIVEVQTQVNVSNARQNVDGLAQLTPINTRKQTVGGVNLNPDTVQVLIPVTQQGGYRDLAVKVVVTGQVANGYRLTNISVTPPVITAYSADPNLVIALPGFVETQPLDLNNAEQNIETRLGLVLPEGVSLVGEQSVLVQAAVSPIMTSITIANKIVEVIGLDPRLGAQISPATVDVILSGPLPLLDQLTPNDIRLFIDLSGLGVGTHQLDPKVEILTPEISLESINPTSIEVVIGPPITPTVTKTP
jgi:YbbR domain-containing protein